MHFRPNQLRGSVVTTCILFIFLLLISLGTAFATEIFKYVDKDGIVHFTNVVTTPDAKTISLGRVVMSVAPRSYQKSYQRYSSQSSKSCDPKLMLAYEPHINMACEKYGVNHNLVKAIIRAESAFDSQAVSPRGALGLMQLMPGTSRDMGVDNPFDPLQNIDGGTRYLKLLMDRFNNDVTLTLAAYNAGPETVQKYGGVPPFDETQLYVQRVMEFYSLFNR